MGERAGSVDDVDASLAPGSAPPARLLPTPTFSPLLTESKAESMAVCGGCCCQQSNVRCQHGNVWGLLLPAWQCADVEAVAAIRTSPHNQGSTKSCRGVVCIRISGVVSTASQCSASATAALTLHASASNALALELPPHTCL